MTRILRNGLESHNHTCVIPGIEIYRFDIQQGEEWDEVQNQHGRQEEGAEA
jgi:hypothetical protein